MKSLIVIFLFAVVSLVCGAPQMQARNSGSYESEKQLRNIPNMQYQQQPANQNTYNGYLSRLSVADTDYNKRLRSPSGYNNAQNSAVGYGNYYNHKFDRDSSDLSDASLSSKYNTKNTVNTGYGHAGFSLLDTMRRSAATVPTIARSKPQDYPRNVNNDNLQNAYAYRAQTQDYNRRSSEYTPNIGNSKSYLQW